MKDAIVVGAGIIGATIGEALRKQGMDVLILDRCEPLAGTQASGGHIKQSWVSSLKKDEFESSLGMLDSVWGLKTEEFKLLPSKKVETLYRVPTSIVLDILKTKASVKKYVTAPDRAIVEYDRGGLTHSESTKLLIIAAGVWSGELTVYVKPELMKAKQGVSFIFNKQIEPFIKPWAPYKQIVAHQESATETWVGDGTVILQKNWNKFVEASCLNRCRAALVLSNKRDPIRMMQGIRPYYPSDDNCPCLFRKVSKFAYVVTGAGKLGTIAAGWAARRIINENL